MRSLLRATVLLIIPGLFFTAGAAALAAQPGHPRPAAPHRHRLAVLPVPHPPARPAAARPAAAPAAYTVQPGDTLSAVARRVCGQATDWPGLWWANRRQVPDPEVLQPGQRLVLPACRTGRWLLARARAAMPRPAPVTAAAELQPVAAVAAQQVTGPPGSFQACVIAAESGGNPAAVNPSSGAGGLYGFLPSTWAALGFPGLPENAPVAVQNAAFAKAYAQSGTADWAPYDGC